MRYKNRIETYVLVSGMVVKISQPTSNSNLRMLAACFLTCVLLIENRAHGSTVTIGDLRRRRSTTISPRFSKSHRARHLE
jgi:hypothetical protein